MNKRTVSQLEDGPEWPRIVARLESASLPDVAREFGLTPGAVAAAMVRSRTSRKAVIAPQVRSDAVEAPVVAHEAPSAPEHFPPEPTASARTAGKLDAHVAGFRAAVQTGSGAAFLAQLHQLVRVNVRSRLARTGDQDLLARFDEDAPSRPAPASAIPSPVRLATPVPATEGARLEPAPVVEARRAPQQARPDIEPPQTPSSHVYVVAVLMDGVRREYGVVATSMADAVATAVSATGTGVVIAARRDLPALV